MVGFWLMKVFSQCQLNIYSKGNVETKVMVPLLRWVDVGLRAHRNELIEFDARCIYSYDSFGLYTLPSFVSVKR